FGSRGGPAPPPPPPPPADPGQLVLAFAKPPTCESVGKLLPRLRLTFLSPATMLRGCTQSANPRKETGRG
ncbi:MAG: hypothetical protein WBD63_00455, partial [Phycisphaerae bacterium]